MRISNGFWVLFLLWGVEGGATETLRYETLDRSVIERRLQAAGSTNGEREGIIRESFRQAGCPEGALQEIPVRHEKVPNVSCTLPGESEATIVVGAHFDFVRRGKGIIDNWSGVSLLPSLLQSVLRQPHHHRWVFIAFTEEEAGLIGSRAYVQGLSRTERLAIHAMVNLDSLGTGETNVELERGDRKLISALGLVAVSLNLPLHGVNVHRVGRSDSDSFQDAKVPTVNVHSLTQKSLPILHSREDQLNAVRMDEYYDSYRLLAAYLAYLDMKLESLVN